MKSHTISLFISPNTNHILFFCIQRDTNLIIVSTLYPVDNYSWLANRFFQTIWPNVQKKRPRRPMMHMNSEKPNRFSCPHFLVSIWLPQERYSAAPGQVSAGFKPNSRPIAPAIKLAPKNEAAGGDRTCPQTRKRNSLSHFSGRHGKACQLWWPKFNRHTKQRSVRKYRHPLSTDSWRDTTGARPRQVGQPVILGECHEHRGQICRRSWPHSQSSFCLVHLGPTAPRYYSCRPNLRATGGAQCFSRIS